MASSFLDNLKKAVETGEFNSDAAKKINDIDKLADAKINEIKAENKDVTETLKDRLEKMSPEETKVTAEEALELNSQYEQRMKEIKEQDNINKALATMIDIEDMVKASIEDMMSYVVEVEDAFSEELASDDKRFVELSDKLKEIRRKYESIIN